MRRGASDISARTAPGLSGIPEPERPGRRPLWPILLPLLVLGFACLPAAAQVLPKLSVGFDKASGPKDVAVTLELVAMLTVLSLAPSILIMMTCFTRVVVVLTFLKQALGTQN